MTHYRFEVSIVVDGVPYAAGDEAAESEIPAGCLASLLRLHQVSEVPAVADAGDVFVGFMEGRPAGEELGPELLDVTLDVTPEPVPEPTAPEPTPGPTPSAEEPEKPRRGKRH